MRGVKEYMGATDLKWNIFAAMRRPRSTGRSRALRSAGNQAGDRVGDHDNHSKKNAGKMNLWSQSVRKQTD